MSMTGMLNSAGRRAPAPCPPTDPTGHMRLRGGGDPSREDRRDLLRASLRDVQAQPGRTAALFQARLGEVAPDLRAVLGGDSHRQVGMPMNMLAIVAACPQDLAPLRPMLADLAARHRGYGVTPRHYRVVGDALLWTLERILGPRLDRATSLAWRKAYGALVDAMLEPLLERAA